MEVSFSASVRSSISSMSAGEPLPCVQPVKISTIFCEPIRQGTHFRTIRGDDTRLTDSFHAFEPDTALRWTNGDATLPATLFAGFSGPCELVVHLGGTASYIDDGAAEKVA